jgi:hypothetical protein
MPWKRGESGNLKGRPVGTKGPGPLTMWELRQEARRHSPKALRRIVECLDDENAKIRLMAAEMILNRAWGRPELSVELNANHSFCVAPQTLPLDEWLATRGQGTSNAWREKQKEKQAPHAKPEALDLEANEPEPELDPPG